MELKDVLLKRRSIRKFKQTPVPTDMIDVLLHAAMSGPSACNRQTWEFYVVTGKEKLAQLTRSSRFMGFDAPLAIVVCGNLSRALPLKFSEYWIQDCSAATENLLLAATDLGLGAVWCGAHPQSRVADAIADCLDLPAKQIPLNVIYIGFPDETHEPCDRYDADKVHFII